MRLIVLTLFAVASIGATDVPPAPITGAPPTIDPATGVATSELPVWPCTGSIPVFNPEDCPQSRLTVETAKVAPPANCKDRIQQVRDASRQPALDKTPATAVEGYLINAVDMRVDGCAVMQMKGDVNDVRPLPTASGPARLQPAL